MKNRAGRDTHPSDLADASYLAGRAELMAYLRKYSVPWRPAIERWLTDDASGEREAVHQAFADLAAAARTAKRPGGIPDVLAMLLKTEKLSLSALMSGVDDRQLARAREICEELGEKAGPRTKK